VSETKKPTEPAESGQRDLWAIVRRAEKGDESTLPALRQALAAHGGLVESAGNLARQVQATLVGNAAGKNLLFRESLMAKVDRLRADLAGPDPTPLENLLADRIALCWLSLHDAEARFAQAEDLTFKQAEFWQHRIDCAHRRYLSAIKTLATIRKFALPALQVNIARRQVNVLNSAPEGSPGASKDGAGQAGRTPPLGEIVPESASQPGDGAGREFPLARRHRVDREQRPSGRKALLEGHGCRLQPRCRRRCRIRCSCGAKPGADETRRYSTRLDTKAG
jgi:hypothetical protein